MLECRRSGVLRGGKPSPGLFLALIAVVGLAVVAAGCGSDSSSSPSTAASSSTSNLQPPGSSIGINAAKHLAYVPAGVNGGGYGQIAVINLAVDPNKTNPLVRMITLSHQDEPEAVLYYAKKNLILVTSGSSGAGGYLDVFDASTYAPATNSPFSFPTGSQSGYVGNIGLLSGKFFNDPADNYAVVSVCDNATCSSGAMGTGLVAYDLDLSGFYETATANYPEYMAANFNTGLIVDASDDDLPGQIGIIDSQGNACVLSDSNLEGDNDSAALDPTTNLVVVSNETGDITVLNLNGGTFSTAVSPCTFTEAGTTPNSAVLTGFSDVLEGGVANPNTHKAFLVGDGDPTIALISLPTKPVKQLTASMLSGQQTMMPDDPFGDTWYPSSNPSFVAINPATNKAYTTYDGFLAQIDLAKFAKNPSAISNSLPTTSQCGSSYGVTGTVAACSNAGNAVVFYPFVTGP